MRTKTGKPLFPNRSNRRTRKEKKREAILAQKQAREQFEKQALASLKLAGFVNTQIAEVGRTVEARHAVPLAGVETANKILGAMKLPEAKKTMARRFFLRSVRAAISFVFPLPKAEAIRIMDDVIQAEKTSIAEARQSDKAQIAKAKENIQRLERFKTGIIKARSNTVTITQETAKIIARYYDYKLRRILGEKNHAFYTRAMKEIVQAAQENTGR